MIDPETLDKALSSLSLAHTALDDPGALLPGDIVDESVTQSMRDNGWPDSGTALHYIEDAMRLLGAGECWIVSRFPTFEAEQYDSRQEAEARLARIATLDPQGHAASAYWIVPDRP